MIDATSRGRLLLAVGMLVGGGLVAAGVVGQRDDDPSAMPDEAVAVVNGSAISRGDYQRAVNAVVTDRRDKQLSREQRERVLHRLIDEELLIQRGLELGLASRVPAVRASLSRAVIDMLVSRSELQKRDVGDQELREFYREHSAYFRRHPRLHVRDVTAEGAAIVVPAGLIPANKLRDYIGAAAVASLAVAAPGDRVVVNGRSYELVARAPGALPAFDQIEDQVRVEYRRRAADTLLRQTLADRRKRAAIAIARDRL